MKRRRPRQVKSKVYNYEVLNRRRHAGAGRWIHGVIVLVLIATATGIGYVWQRNKQLGMGYTISTLRDKEIPGLEAECTKVEADLNALREPGRIQRLVKERGLGLVQPTGDKVVYRTEPEPITLPEDDEQSPPLGRKIWDAIVLGKR
jgi:hypothetical protein